MPTHLYPYSTVSTSARLLAQAMGLTRIKRERSRYRPRAQDVIVNWGCSVFGIPTNNTRIINRPEAVRVASNKLNTFQVLRQNNIPVPDWTLQKEEAQRWLRDGHTVYGRDSATASEGRYITVYSGAVPGQALGDHRFYVKKFKSKVELRIHIFRNGTVNIQRKAKRDNWQADYGHIPNGQHIRNTANGFVFVRGDINPFNINYNGVISGVHAALNALGLDFGAFDVLVQSNGSYVILECNTAPGIEGTTLEVYRQTLAQI